MKATPDLSRRDFLNATASVGGGLILALTRPGPGSRSNSAAAAPGKSAGQLNAWLRIAPDNSITIIVDRVRLIRRYQVNARSFMARLLRILAEQGKPQAVEFCRKYEFPIQS